MNKLAASIVLLVAPLSHGAEILLVSESVAWANPGRVWIHVTNAPYCKPCETEEGMFHDPVVVEASRKLNCVVLCWCDDTLHERISQYGVTRFPTDLIVSTDRKRTKPFVGCPASADDLAARLNYQFVPANPAPQGPQHSVVTGGWCDPVTGICYGPQTIEPRRPLLGGLLRR